MFRLHPNKFSLERKIREKKKQQKYRYKNCNYNKAKLLFFFPYSSFDSSIADVVMTSLTNKYMKRKKKNIIGIWKAKTPLLLYSKAIPICFD